MLKFWHLLTYQFWVKNGYILKYTVGIYIKEKFVKRIEVSIYIYKASHSEWYRTMRMWHQSMSCDTNQCHVTTEHMHINDARKLKQTVFALPYISNLQIKI